MKTTRRSVLQVAGAGGLYAALVSAGMLKPGSAEAATFADAFKAKGVKSALEALGAAGAEKSDKVQLIAPDIAENGAVVPLALSTTLPNVKQLVLMVEKNPSPLVAVFNVTPDIEASFATRSKMGQSSDVYAIAVTTDGKALFTKKEVKVTLGGCGG